MWGTMRKILMLAVLGAAACGPGRGGPSGAVSPLALQPPPIYSIFGYRDALGLTSEQVETLDSIAQDVKRRNDAVADTLRAIADRRGGRQRGIIPLNEETRPMLEQVAANNRAAALAVQTTLTEEQQVQVCRLGNDPRRSRAREHQPPERHADIAPADSTLLMPLIGGWPWCTEPPAEG